MERRFTGLCVALLMLAAAAVAQHQSARNNQYQRRQAQEREVHRAPDGSPEEFAAQS